MKWNLTTLAVALASVCATTQAQNLDPLQVRSWAAACANCHGTNGVAQSGNESLAGGNKDELLKKMLRHQADYLEFMNRINSAIDEASHA